MKRSILLLGVVLATMIGCSADGRRFASIGTAGTGGVYYPLGGALARMLGESLPGITFTAEVTGGTVENFNRVVSGEMDLGMGMGSALTTAAATASADVRIVAPLYDNLTHVMVRAGSGIDDIADLRGKRVSFGPAGSGTEELSRDLLASADITPDQVEARYLSFSESAGALVDGAIDAAILSVGLPAAAVLEATTSGNVTLIGMRPQQLDALLARFSYYEPASLPAGAYPGVDRDLPTFAVRNWLFGLASLDGEIVSATLETLRLRRDELQQVNAIAARIDLQALRIAPLSLHPATEAWMQQQR